MIVEFKTSKNYTHTCMYSNIKKHYSSNGLDTCSCEHNSDFCGCNNHVESNQLEIM